MRDGHMTGLSTGPGGFEALTQFMRPFASDQIVSLTFDAAALPTIENLLYQRDFMYVNCYEQPDKLAAERAFARLAEEAISGSHLTVDQLMLLTDDDVLSLLLERQSGSQALTGLAMALLKSVSYEQVFERKPSEASNNPEVKHWVEMRLMGGTSGGFKQAYVILPRLWERRIAERAGIRLEEDWKILVSVPPHQAYVQKESGARILVEGGDRRYTTVDLFDYSKRLKPLLEQMRPASAFIRVFASTELSVEERQRVTRAANELLG